MTDDSPADTAARRDAELAIWRAELEEIDRAVDRHESFRAQTFVFGTGGVVLLVVLAFEVGASGAGGAEPLVFLLISFVCAFLGMFLVDRDEAMLALINYRETVIKPQVRKLIGSTEVLGYQEFFNREAYGTNRPLLRKIAHRLTAPFPHALFYVGGLGSFGYLAYLRLATTSLEGAAWVWALAIAAIAQIYSWTAALLTGGQWAQIGSPAAERGIPFLRRRVRWRLPNPDGWWPGDPHTHTNRSDGWRSVWSQAEAASRAGLAWIGITDHSGAVGEDWCNHVAVLAEVEKRLGLVTIVPGVEVTVVDHPGGRAQGDVLVYGWPHDAECLPPDRVATAGTLLELVSARSALAAIAHPHGGGAPMNKGVPGLPFGAPAWSGESTDGVGCMELLSHEREVSEEARETWFSHLGATLGDAAPLHAIGGSDAHMPWARPGARGMTWVRTRGTGRPDAAAIVSAMRAGHSVVSGAGDFATIAIGDAGPGDRAVVIEGRFTVSCTQRPTRGRTCTRVELIGIAAGEAADGADGSITLCEADGPLEPTFTLDCSAKPAVGFVVGHFVFADSRAGRRVADVWTNPVLITRS
jgi:hypothetical protein